MNEAKWQDARALGHAARHRGRREEALTHYRAALALAPDHAETNGVCGSMLLELDRVDEAAPLLRRAIDLDPSHPAARTKPGRGLRGNSQIKRRAEARRRE